MVYDLYLNYIHRTKVRSAEDWEKRLFLTFYVTVVTIAGVTALMLDKW